MSRFRPWLVLLSFAALTLPLMPLQQLFVWFWPRMARRFPMHYHRMVCRLLGLRIEVTGTPPQAGPVLIVSNHVSWLDIVVLSAVAPLSFIAKREVREWPFFGTLARLQRTVFIDRNRRHATGTKRDEMQDRLKARDILVLFPEGTSSNGHEVLPFKSSFFGAAENEGVLVQPVSLAYCKCRNLPMNRRLMPSYAWYGEMELAPHLWEALATGPVDVSVTFHAPLSVSGEGNRKLLARHAEEKVRQGVSLALHGSGKTR